MRIITTVWALFLVLPTIIFLSNYDFDNTFQIEVYKVGDGFGYNITADEVIIIKQENIPAIREQKNFTSYEHAHMTAGVVVEKLNKGVNPRISIEELKKLGLLSALDY